MNSGQNPATASPWLGLLGYAALIVSAVILFFVIRQAGAGLSAPPAPPDATLPGRTNDRTVDVIFHVVATLAAVIALGVVLGRLLHHVGQPPVIGEVLAGILLGPSLLGGLWPEAMHALIPPPDIDSHGQVPAALKAISQVGLILYMFLVGLDLNASRLKHQAQAALVVSHASIVVPFVLGAALALVLYPLYAYQGVPFTSFALFLGVALAVTAFPVLARILTDRNLDKTELGVLALSCAAADDVTAWCLLAVVVGVAHAQIGGALLVVAGLLGFLLIMFYVIQPILVRISNDLDHVQGPLPTVAVSGAFLAVLLAALTTEWIGVHAVFGAFLLGAILPHDGRLAREFSARWKDPVMALLLPAFFACTGMRTQVGLLNRPEDWIWCLVVLVVATVGKLGGTMISARLVGYPWRDATALGALMNTRGLMGLIVLDIGLNLGIISPTLYTMMVMMALATTMTTAPLLGWLCQSMKAEKLQAHEA